MSRVHIPGTTRPSARPSRGSGTSRGAWANSARWVPAAIILTLSCGDSTAEPEPPPSPVATSVTVTPASVTLTAIAETILLSAEVRDQNGQVMAGASVTWSSSDPSVASVGSGVVEAVSDGTTTVTASSGAASGTAAVSVVQTPAMVLVHPDSVALASIGDTVRIAAEVRDRHGFVIAAAQVTWSSSGPSVASVDASGLVTAVGGGSATVTASSGPASGDVGVVVQSGTASSDREALEALYHAAGGSSWTRSDNWLTDAPLREWFGVIVDDANRVRRLVLADNGLRGSIPPELGTLTALRVLALEKNRLSGSIPSELGGLAGLLELYLFSNELSGRIPPELGNLREITQLALHNNSLSGSIPNQLGNLRRLGQLFLQQNDLTGAIPNELGQLAELQWIVLSYNRLTGPIPPELGRLSNLYNMGLNDNSLSGPVPPSFGGLSRLERLILRGNAGLTGALPTELTNIGGLDQLLTRGTGLCAPSDAGLQSWLDRVRRAWVPLCGGNTPVAYLTQTVQSPRFPVPLVEGEQALLRVFPTAARANSASLPAVRASFFLAGSEVHVANVAARSGPIPTAVDEGNLARSVNAVIPAEVMRPGLEMVVEIDPEGQLDPALGVPKRIPATGRMAVDVRRVPAMQVTFIPFVWSANPDRSVVDLATAMAADPLGHDMLFMVRTLLPVADLRVTAHEPVTTSSNNAGDLIAQTRMIRAAEGGTGHYAGLMAGMTGAQGAAGTPGWASVSIPTQWIMAHELGHNLSLDHAPCSTNSALDQEFPQADGTTGAWGYDFRGAGRLVPPDSPDLMGYCLTNQWISGYSFNHALRYRLYHQGPASAATESLLLWGGVDGSGTPYLEPAFVVDASPSLPDSAGEYQVAGWTADGRELFSLPFTMPTTSDGDGASSFAFAVPARPGWATDLAGVTLAGPGGSITLDGDTARPMAIIRHRESGQVRGVLRDVPRTAGNFDAAMARVAAQVAEAQGVFESDLQVLFSRGIPDATAWRRR